MANRLIEAIDAVAERDLPIDEARAYLNAPITDFDRENFSELVTWFCRRYPTPAERLAYVRRAYKRWNALRGIAWRQSKG